MSSVVGCGSGASAPVPAPAPAASAAINPYAATAGALGTMNPLVNGIWAGVPTVGTGGGTTQTRLTIRSYMVEVDEYCTLGSNVVIATATDTEQMSYNTIYFSFAENAAVSLGGISCEVGINSAATYAMNAAGTQLILTFPGSVTQLFTKISN